MAEKKSIKETFEFCRALSNSINERIKENPEAEVNKEDLQALVEPFEDVIDFVKTYLILAQDSLYGAVLMSIDTTVSFKSRSLIDLVITGTNFIMTFNPLYIGNYQISELITKTVAEVLRLIYEHPAVFADINSTKDPNTHKDLEDASDAASSSLIERDIHLDSASMKKNTLNIPDDMYTVSNIIEDTDIRPKEKESIEYYYKVLDKFRKRNPQNSGGGPGQSLGSGSASSDEPSGKGVASPENNDGSQSHDWENKDSEKTQEQIRSLIYSVYDNLDSKARGNIPSSILEQINRMLAKPEISWKDQLKKYLGSVPFPYRPSAKRLNRKQPFRNDLRGRLPKRKVNIVVCIDTSGSMSNDDIEYCMNEIFHIIKENETKVTIIECDCVVGRVYEAKKPSDIRPDCSGRGGTAFTPAIEYINSEGKFKDALMIYFTDGYGEGSIPKPLTYRNLWVVLKGTNNLSLEEPYGEVKSLEMDGDYRKYKGRN